MLIEEALKWNISVEVLDPREGIIRLKQNNKVEIVKEGALTSHTQAIALEIANNKAITKRILSEHGFTTPRGAQFFSYEESLENYSQFKNKSIVIKPNGSMEGTGISFVSPNQPEEYKSGIKRALEEQSCVLVEEHCSGTEYRILIMGNEVIGIIHRKPANVIGNGTDTIDELIRKKNMTRRAAIRELISIRITPVEIEILAGKNYTLESIPDEGERVFLRHNSNISTGGDSIESNAIVHDYYKQIGIKAAKLLQLPICCLDMLIPSPENKGNYTIIELNAIPGLTIHTNPTIGKPVNAGKALLDFLGFHDPREQ
jgi:glutamate--cysteine ligase